MSSIAHPLILVEVIPIISRDGNNCSSTSHPISQPLAKTQLLNMSLRGMFHPGWMKYEEMNERLHKLEKGSKWKNRGGAKKASSDSSWGMSLRTFHETNKTNESKSACSSRRKAIISGIVHFKTEGYGITSDCNNSDSIPVTYLLADDPLCESGVPCVLRGYIFENDNMMEPIDDFISIEHEIKCAVVSGTSVQVLPPIDAQSIADHTNFFAHCDLGTSLLGSYNSQKLIIKRERRGIIQQCDSPKKYSKLSCYDEATVRALTLLMSTMLLNTTWVGTTPWALSVWKSHIRKTMNEQLPLDSLYDLQQKYCIDNENSCNNLVPTMQQIDSMQCASEADSVPYLLREGALLLYNTHPNSGKRTLVTTIAKEILHCNAVHVVSAPAIFAKYGTSADAALEIILHELAVRGAVTSVSSEPSGGSPEKGQEKNSCIARVCIVLDHFETFINHASNADSYTPVLNSMESYVNRLSFSLKNKNEFPFPSTSSLYNRSGLDSSRSPGFALPLGLCLIGVMTCNDDRNKTQTGSQLSKALDTIGGGRICLSLPSEWARLSAFYHAFRSLDIELDEEATHFLPEFTESKSWAIGRSFLDVARELRSLVEISGRRLATKTDLKKAMDVVDGIQTKSSASGTYSTSSLSNCNSSSTDLGFGLVGGNKEAKLALEDALALNPEKRRLLSLFGLQAPTGVLLYGPPGTGKTLLARAVAQAMSTPGSGRPGNHVGKFISLKASDIVRPEVGNSEKLIVTAFEAARVNAPSVIFIDEFQALFGDRDGSGLIVGQLVSTLLQCMDDVARWSEADPAEEKDGAKNGRIVVIGATNTPWMIDRAFLRPGRFDRAVHVGLPCQEEREEILRVHSCKMKMAPTENRDETCKMMAELCIGFSGADLAALCRAAAVRCLSEGDDAEGIKAKHFKYSFMNHIVRSSNNELVQRISNWRP
eukprot:CCRYP_005668-RA/>CCRYP_005668-RA protein AED:0.02 eAED:0.02 QI:256/1/0.75/1/0.66/0.5/4/0/935